MNYSLFIFFIILMLIVMVAWIMYLQRIIFDLKAQINDFNSEGNNLNRRVKRNSSKLNPVSFSNPIQARKNLYKDYENEKGLYEPVTPSKGIKIKEGR